MEIEWGADKAQMRTMHLLTVYAEFLLSTAVHSNIIRVCISLASLMHIRLKSRPKESTFYPGNGFVMSIVGRFGTMLPLFCVEPPRDNPAELPLRVEGVSVAV